MSACGTPSSRLPGKVHNRSSPILPSMAGSKVTVVELQRSTSLSAPHCIRRYVVNGSAYLEIPNSLKHQKCRQDHAGEQTKRSTCRAANQIRDAHQLEDSQSARDHCACYAARPSRQGHRMTRRDLIALLGSTAVTWPLGARPRQGWPS